MLIDARGAATLEEAFIGYMEDAIGEGAAGGPGKEAPPPPRRESLGARGACRPFAAPWSASRLQRQ